jgi:hypothetical protein
VPLPAALQGTSASLGSLKSGGSIQAESESQGQACPSYKNAEQLSHNISCSCISIKTSLSVLFPHSLSYEATTRVSISYLERDVVRPRINVLFLSTLKFGDALLFQKMKAYTILEQPVSSSCINSHSQALLRLNR